jgi:hypothetical protein
MQQNGFLCFNAQQGDLKWHNLAAFVSLISVLIFSNIREMSAFE